MGKLLRVLVIIFLVLSAAAFTLGLLLFEKRELLKGRTQKLEQTLLQLASTLEAGAPTVERKPEFPAKDISPVGTERVDTPDLSTFWDTYQPVLELAAPSTLDLRPRQYELMNYYRRDRQTGRIVRDPLGRPETRGEGTMQAVLDEVLTRATEQYTRLNDTRRQLVAVRTELVNTIAEHNQQKNQLRASLRDIEQKKAEIARLNGEVRNLNARVDDLTAEKRQLEEQVAEHKRAADLMRDQMKEKDAEVAQLKKDLADCKGMTLARADGTGPTRDVSGAEQERILRNIGPGDKGRVLAVNPEWNFVVVQLEEAFLKELLGEDLQGDFPRIELMVRRPGEKVEFVSKVRLNSLRKADGVAIADNLSDWQQKPLESGDVLFK